MFAVIGEIKCKKKKLPNFSLAMCEYKKCRECIWHIKEKRMCLNCEKQIEKGAMIVPEIVMGGGWKDRYFCCEKCIKEYKKYRLD